MKTLLLVRHAKSSWDSSTLKDFDRPLDERGHKDAVKMGRILVAKKIAPDTFISSTAMRAKTTAEYFAKELDFPSKKIIFLDELYHAPPLVFYGVINTLEAEKNTAIIFAHNPGITDLVNSLGVAKLDDMPTCGIFGIVAKTKHWQGFQDAEKQFLLFEYPKKLG